MTPRDGRGALRASRTSEGSQAELRTVAPGFTLLEVVVVLVIVGLGATLVVPALSPSTEEGRAALPVVIRHVQDMALRRGETLLLDVSPGGHWDVFGSVSLEDGAVAAGEISEGRPAHAFTLRVAPLGSCGLTLDSDSVGPPPDLDPLTCRVRSP